MDGNIAESTLTSATRKAIEQAFTKYDSNSDGYLREFLAMELGMEQLPGRYPKIPATHNNTTLVEGPEDREFVLKYCHGHAPGSNPTACNHHIESWMWEEAKRRGDEDLFAPIIASSGFTVDYHWELMIWGEWGGNDQLEDKTMEHQLRGRGWYPADIESRVIEGQTVVIDYDLVFPIDMFGSLYDHSMNRERSDEWKAKYTPITCNEIQKWENKRYNESTPLPHQDPEDNNARPTRYR